MEEETKQFTSKKYILEKILVFLSLIPSLLHYKVNVHTHGVKAFAAEEANSGNTLWKSPTEVALFLFVKIFDAKKE